MNKIIVVSGPTASGKTALAVEIAKKYGGEVISADSMQIYTDMDVASAKATPEEQQGIPHHLMDFLDPAESFSVADWVRMAGECAGAILSRGKIPVICGGTGLYISSFVDNLQFDESECDYAFREEMRRFAEEHGAEALLEQPGGGSGNRRGTPREQRVPGYPGAGGLQDHRAYYRGIQARVQERAFPLRVHSAHAGFRGPHAAPRPHKPPCGPDDPERT